MATKDTRANKEQQLVVKPLVEYLHSIGWNDDQMVYGKKEWYVPKTPSQATKREQGKRYDGFPVDIALFDSPKRIGDYRHLPIIVECKQPDEEKGVSQLETYMALEHHVKLGVWTNSADPTALVVYVYRLPSGKLIQRKRLLADFPGPGDRINEDDKKLTYKDLKTPSEGVFKTLVEDLLDHVVTNDSKVTRREEQLDQLCDLLLLKLDSDKEAKAAKTKEPYFRPRATAAETADVIRDKFADLVNLYPEVFRDETDKQLRLDNSTIGECVERLAPYKLVDNGSSTIAVAFQVLRAAALKQGEGQFFTPQQVIEAGVKLLQVQWDDIVIDPACGTGGFLVEVLLDMKKRHPEDAEMSRWAQKHIYGIDKDSVGVKLTKAVMQIAGDGSANCSKGDSVRVHEWSTKYPELLNGGYKNGRFTVVVTNPPFGSNLKVPADDSRLAGLDIAKAGGSDYKDLEIGLLFLQRSYDLLRVGGRLGIILPETYFFSENYQFLFDWIRERLRPVVVLNVPMEAFQGFCRAKTNFYVFEKIG